MTDRQYVVPSFKVTPDDGSLGANVNHDERSKAYGVGAADGGTIHSVNWRHYGAPLNQGNILACTGFTAADWFNTKPNKAAKHYTNKDGFTFYSNTTKIDPFPGEWNYPPPPGNGTDTGSDALSTCKMLKDLGLISAYKWGFGFDQVLGALMLGPVMIGSDWYEGFDNPDAAGFVAPTGKIRGRHEYMAVGYDAPTGRVKLLNHWGAWGLNGKGIFYYDAATLRTLLDQQGDAVVPVK